MNAFLSAGFPLAPLPLATTILDSAWQSVTSATLMLTVVGLCTAVLLRRVSVNSWRLRSALVAAVLLQGMMLCKAPIYLGWIESHAQSSAQPVTRSLEHDSLSLSATDPLWAHSFTQHSAGDSAAVTHTPRSLSMVPGVGFTRVIVVLWLLVMGVIFAVALVRYVRLVRLVARLGPAPEPWQRAWKRLALRSSRRQAVRRSEMLLSQSVGPMLVRQPFGYALIVPESYWNGLSEGQRNGVMLHELAHLERGDVWRQLIARAIATVHWFNPVAWWALREYEQAAELACDQRVTGDGKATAAGFASALLELVQWHQRYSSHLGQDRRREHARGMGFQAMAAPPLSNRISHLLKSPSHGDPLMKRIVLALFAATLVAASFFQIRLTEAQNRSNESEPAEQLRVISDGMAGEIDEIAANLDLSDPTTKRFASLLDTTEGELALSGMLNQLVGAAREETRADAIGRFAASRFVKSDQGKLSIRPEHEASMERWKKQSARLADDFDKLKATTDDLASRLDTSSEAGGLFKRFLEDPQAPPAILLFEMKNGGDVIGRFISKAMDRILVDRGDGTFQIVDSRRQEAEAHIQRFAMAEKLSDVLRRQLPTWADEFDKTDQQHQQLISYMNNPLMATIVGLGLSEDGEVSSPTAAVSELFGKLEKVCRQTPQGLRIEDEETWNRFQEIFTQVDRAAEILPRVQERLSELADTLSTSDPLSKRFAEQLRSQPVAVLMSAELPYAEADPGEELRALLSEVLTETSDNRLKVNASHEQEVAEKAKELLQVCRAIRRHLISVDEMLDQVDDRNFVEAIGDSGRYLLLSEIRQFAESHRPNPIELMIDKLLIQTESGEFRVREDRREIVGQLVQQSEKVRDEASNDDF